MQWIEPPNSSANRLESATNSSPQFQSVRVTIPVPIDWNSTNSSPRFYNSSANRLEFHQFQSPLLQFQCQSARASPVPTCRAHVEKKSDVDHVRHVSSPPTEGEVDHVSRQSQPRAHVSGSRGLVEKRLRSPRVIPRSLKRQTTCAILRIRHVGHTREPREPDEGRVDARGRHEQKGSKRGESRRHVSHVYFRGFFSSLAAVLTATFVASPPAPRPLAAKGTAQ